MNNQTLNLNGERLKKARIYRGLTVAELAEKIDCQRQTVSMYENNKIKCPDDSTVQKLSETLGFPIKYFFENQNHINIGSTYFRALLTTNKKYRNKQIQKMEFLSQIFMMLQDYVYFPTLDLPDIDNNILPEDASIKLREKWGLGNKPIANIIYEVEKHGILVTQFDTETNDIDAFSQMSYLENESIYLIGYSKNKTSASRIHFDIAHELGHICMHEWSEDVEMLTKQEFKSRENEANQFASAFLLPKESYLKDAIKNPKSIPYYTQLKSKWKVSISAMIRRSLTLGLLTHEEYQMLLRTLQRRGMRKIEPLDNKLLTAEPSLLKTALLMLLNEKIFTPKEFIDELSFSYNLSLLPHEIEMLLDLPDGTLKTNNVIPIHDINLK